MKARTEDDFNRFMSQLLETNAPLSFYTDFEKCNANVERIAMRLNQLNYLIGQEDLENAVKRLWEENSNVFSVLDILIAVRTRDNKKAVDNNGEIHTISSFFETVEGVITYIKETGLQEVFRQKQVKNLVDYVFGVEVGLDTNARKNRSGDIMETIVAGVFKKNGIRYRKEIYSTEFPEIEKALGEDKKCFDFVIETTCKTYLFEVNFYNSNGSKPNEVARAYTELAPKINACKGYEFVWITDGKGWSSAKKMLAEAFYAIPSVYNLTTINEFIAEIKSKK